LWNFLVANPGADFGSLENVSQVSGEAIRDVDAGARGATQALAELDAGLRRVQAVRRRGDLGMRQGERRPAERAGDPEVVARARTGARERLAGGHFAEGGDVDRERTARRVTAD